MTNHRFSILSLNSDLDRTTFDSGSEPLNKYFHQQVGQDVKRNMAACFIAVDEALNIAGYYTLAAASIPLNDLPSDLLKKLPRYPSVTAIKMRRLAIDVKFQRQRLGAALLADGLERASNTEIAAYALIVDAKDKKAADFYSHYDFITLPDSPFTLFLPLATVHKIKNNT